MGGGGEGGRDTEKKYYLTKFTGLQASNTLPNTLLN